MSDEMARKVSIVTGAAGGIGGFISQALAKAGATVVLASRNQEALEQKAQEIHTFGGSTLVVPTDLADEESIKNLVKTTEVEYGRLDVLVNCAGVHPHVGPLEDTETRYWDQCMTINARAPFLLCRESIPLLRKSDGARIINISSVVGVKGYSHQAEYTASKHALRGMSMALAEELRVDGIRVHVVCPGGVRTPLVSSVRPDIKVEDLILPEEVAELVLYLASHQGNAVVDELHIRRATAAPWF